jgi:hypothetical protein
MEVSPHKEGEKTSNPVLDGILNSEQACTMQYFYFLKYGDCYIRLLARR